MKAGRRLQLVHERASRAPRFLTDQTALEHLEIVEIETAETALFLDVPAADAPRIARAMKADLAGMETEDFLAKWSAALDG